MFIQNHSNNKHPLHPLIHQNQCSFYPSNYAKSIEILKSKLARSLPQLVDQIPSFNHLQNLLLDPPMAALATPLRERYIYRWREDEMRERELLLNNIYLVTFLIELNKYTYITNIHVMLWLANQPIISNPMLFPHHYIFLGSCPSLDHHAQLKFHYFT